MIRVTRLDGTSLILNSDLIESVEATPDTVIRLTTQKRVLVRESPAEIVARVVRFQRRVSRLAAIRRRGSASLC